MENIERAKRVLEYYNLTTKLKNVLRTGFIRWHISDNVRAESIAEHIYGTLMLAVGIASNLDENINIEKICLMLALHETEELIIGDLTPFDDVKNATKIADGRKAVYEIFSVCLKKEKLIGIIEEFEAQETFEAKFARKCDKLECCLQSINYDNENAFEIDKCYDLLSDRRIVALREKGYKTVSEFFVQYQNSFLTSENDIFHDIFDLIKTEPEKE